MIRFRGLTPDEERSNYIRWVDHIIALRKSCDIQDFRVHFSLNRTSEKYIDKWVKYALAGKVKRLELELTDHGELRFPCPYDECYTFPYRYLSKGKEDCPTGSQSSIMRQCKSIHFKYLEKLRMHNVNVNSEALEFFLHNCPLLWHLSVSRSGELQTLKIIGPFPPLKYVEIEGCENLASLEIRDASLVCFKYKALTDSMQHFVLENVPLLVEVSIGGMYFRLLRDVMVMFSSILPQLAKLYIDGVGINPCDAEMLHLAVTMNNLKQLVVDVSGHEAHSQRRIINILRASPCLEILVLEAFSLRRPIKKRKMHKIVVGSYPRLKEVRFVGYRGFVSDVELILHLLESCEALEKIVIDPCVRCPTPYDYYCKHNYPEDEKQGMDTLEETKARNRAHKNLAPKIPSRVCLQIL